MCYEPRGSERFKSCQRPMNRKPLEVSFENGPFEAINACRAVRIRRRLSTAKLAVCFLRFLLLWTQRAHFRVLLWCPRRSSGFGSRLLPARPRLLLHRSSLAFLQFLLRLLWSMSLVDRKRLMTRSRLWLPPSANSSDTEIRAARSASKRALSRSVIRGSVRRR